MRQRPALLLFICVATLLAAGLWLPLRAMLVRDWPVGWPGTESRVPVFPEPVQTTADSRCARKPQHSGASAETGATATVVPAEADSRSPDAVARL